MRFTPPNKTQAAFNAIVGIALLLIVGPRLVRLLPYGIGPLLALLTIVYVALNLAFYLGWKGPVWLSAPPRRFCPHCSAPRASRDDRFCRTCGRPMNEGIRHDTH